MTGKLLESSDPRTIRVAAVGSRSLASPSFRVRVLLFRAHLAEAQIYISPLTLFREAEEAALHQVSLRRKWTLARAARKRFLAELTFVTSDVSVTLIQRQADIFPMSRLEHRAIANRGFVYDVDDAIWLDAWGANGSVLAFLKGSRTKTHWLARTADHVIAGNDFIAEHLEPYARRLTVIPSVVDTSRSPLRSHADRDELIVGWIGSRTTAPYVARVQKTLRRFAELLKPRHMRLLMVGGAIEPPPGLECESIPWSVENERAALQRMDIGILPQPNTRWIRGKCAYKAIQYMAAGIPVIADDVGVSESVVADGGIVVRSDSEWLDALATLADDARQRSEIGMRGRNRAHQAYSVERWAPILADVLRGIA
jgi:glycosyltransferase involved in cell wall biosynthesis